jgi:hypothetical protein
MTIQLPVDSACSPRKTGASAPTQVETRTILGRSSRGQITTPIQPVSELKPTNEVTACQTTRRS